MLQVFCSTRRAAALAIAALSLGHTACSLVEDANEVEVRFMRITVGGQVVIVDPSGTVAGAPIELLNDIPENMTVEFLNQRANATIFDALGEHADEYQFNFTTRVGIIFARTSAFSGTLTGTINGTTNVAFALFHIEENREAFGPFSVPVRVVSPPIIDH